MALGDLNGDGKLDLAVPNEDQHTVSVLINRSVSGAIKFDARVEFTTDSRPLQAAIGDLDGDGQPELVTANYAGTITILRHTGDSTRPIPAARR